MIMLGLFIITPPCLFLNYDLSTPIIITAY